MHFVNNKLDSIQGLGKGFLICVIAGNLILCVIGLVAVPSMIEYSKLHINIQKPVMIGLSVALIIIAGVFITLLGYFSQRHGKHLKNKDIKEHIKRMGIFVLVFICFYFAWFLLCGLLGSAVYLFFRQSLSYTQIKMAIDIITTVLAVLAMPVVLMQLLSFSLSALPARQAVRAGLERLPAGYFRLLFLACAGLLAGALLSWLFSLPGGGGFLTALEVIAFTALGSISTCIIYETGNAIYAGGRK